MGKNQEFQLNTININECVIPVNTRKAEEVIIKHILRERSPKSRDILLPFRASHNITFSELFLILKIGVTPFWIIYLKYRINCRRKKSI